MRLILVAALLLLGACTPMQWRPTSDFPVLEERVHVLPTVAMRDYCAPLMGSWQRATGGIPFGCVEFDLCERTCDIWISGDIPGGIGHEQLHCQGYDHWFDSTMADALEEARRSCPESL